jgi:hypothetical protein
MEQDQKETRQIELFHQHNLMRNIMQTQQRNRRQETTRTQTSMARDIKEEINVPFVLWRQFTT